MRTSTRFVSVVMPCLNEEDSVVDCIRDAFNALGKLKKSGVRGEVIVVDNGSTDASVSRIKTTRARLIVEKRRGYGYAYKAGIRKSHGNYIIMGDCDSTYDFRQIPAFIKKLDKGADLVLGSRFTGHIQSGAMKPLNRYIGNPILTAMLNMFYKSRITDAHTGYRAFTRRTVRILALRSDGMEFASEMIVKAIYQHLTITEIPITYYRRGGKSKLSPFVDALRHIRFLVLFAPTYTFIVPGMTATILGAVVSLLLLPHSQTIGPVTFDIHTLMGSVLIMSFGIQLFFIGIFARRYTERVLHLHGGSLGKHLLHALTFEKLFGSGSVLFVAGFIMTLGIAIAWIQSGFGVFTHIRDFIFSAGITIVGLQIISFSLFYGFFNDRT